MDSMVSQVSGLHVFEDCGEDMYTLLFGKGFGCLTIAEEALANRLSEWTVLPFFVNISI
jgi:hypothetical protein